MGETGTDEETNQKTEQINDQTGRQHANSEIVDFTSGSIAKELVIFTAPLFLSNLLQVVYNFVDMLVVGQSAGSVGLSAISVGGDIANFMLFLAMGFSNAGQVIISQYIGAGQDEKISPFIGTMTTFLLGCGLIISIVVILGRDVFLGWMNTPAEAWDYAMDYTVICSVGMVFIYGYNMVSAILRGFGDARHPFIFVSVAAVLNVILDLVFVLGFGWAAAGAALATVLSQTLSFLLSVGFLFHDRQKMDLDFSLHNFAIQTEYLSTLVRLGVPMAIKSAAVQFSKLFVNSFVNSYGVVVSAVSGIGNKLNTIANLFSNSINTAGSSMVGQNIGAEKYERVSRVIWDTFLIDLGLMLILVFLLVTWPEAIFSLFTSDASVLPVAMEYIPIGVLVFLGSAFRASMNTLLNGGGNYNLNFVVAMLDGIIDRIGFGLLFGLVMHMDYFGFWLGDAVAGFTPFVIGGVYYLTGKWKTRKYVIQE